MSVYLADAAGNQEMVASNRGWSDATDFAESQDDEVILHFFEHGYYEPAGELAESIKQMDKSDDPDVQAVFDNVSRFVEQAGDDVVMVTNGMQPDDEAQPPADQ